MRKRTLGLLFAVASLLALASLVQDFRLDHTLATDRASAASASRGIAAVEVALADFRAAQAGYLAMGQGPDFWMRRASELSGHMADGLTGLQAATTSDSARPRYDAAVTALEDLQAIDKRIRGNLETDQRFLAADLVFSESLEPAQRLSTALSEAAGLEVADHSARASRVSMIRLAMNAGALIVLGIVAAIGLRRPKAAPVSSAAETALMLRQLPPPVKPALPVARPAPAPPPPAPVTSVNLPDAATLCVDLARVIDGRDIPVLLERAAGVLDAKGVIIWSVDDDGRTLRPSLAHGYPDKVITRLGVLESEADNVTSLSFRSMRPQTMQGSAPGTPGAIAIPLVTASGCRGVLAAEVRENRPAPETIAMATIIGAQFATLIAPSETVTAKAAEA